MIFFVQDHATPKKCGYLHVIILMLLFFCFMSISFFNNDPQLSVMKDRKYEHAQTANLANVLRECVTLKQLMADYSKRKGMAEGKVQVKA